MLQAWTFSGGSRQRWRLLDSAWALMFVLCKAADEAAPPVMHRQHVDDAGGLQMPGFGVQGSSWTAPERSGHAL